MAKKKNVETDLPIYLFKQGTNFEAYRFFGAHFAQENGESGVKFRVWAPNAKEMSVVGEFNSWVPGDAPMKKISESGIWECFIPGLNEYDIYKYCVTTPSDELIFKTDPYAFHTETRPSNCSKIYSLEGYEWKDGEWYQNQQNTDTINSPMNIYEMHAGSWRTYPDGNPFSYSQLADELIVHNQAMMGWLKNRGYSKKMVNLEIFDYANPQPVNDDETYQQSLCFAGNLFKSEFLRKLQPSSKNFIKKHTTIYSFK